MILMSDSSFDTFDIKPLSAEIMAFSTYERKAEENESSLAFTLLLYSIKRST
jgi:hypothetical protein